MTIRMGLAEILEMASTAKLKKDKIAILKQNDSPQLRSLFQLAWDPRYKWLLPEGDVPYTPTRFPDQQGMLYQAMRKFYLFVDGIPRDSAQQTTWEGLLKKGKRGTIIREQRFIEMMETLDPKDAALVGAVKDKKIPYKGLSRALIQEVWPGLVPIDSPSIVPEEDAYADLHI